TMTTRLFSLVADQTAVFTLTNLPVGSVTFGEQVYTGACGLPPIRGLTWAATPITVTLQAGVPVTLRFELHRVDMGGQVAIQTNFPDPAQAFKEPLINSPRGTTPDDITAGPDNSVWFTDPATHFVGRIGSPTDAFPEEVHRVFIGLASRPTGIVTG